MYYYYYYYKYLADVLSGSKLVECKSHVCSVTPRDNAYPGTINADIKSLYGVNYELLDVPPTFSMNGAGRVKHEHHVYHPATVYIQ